MQIAPKALLSAPIWRPSNGTCGPTDTSCRMMAAADAIHASVGLAADKKRRDYGVFCSELNRVPHLSTHLPICQSASPSNPPPHPTPHPSPPIERPPILGYCGCVCVCVSSPRLRDQHGHWCHLILTPHLYSCREATKVQANCMVLVLPSLWPNSSPIPSWTVYTFCMHSSKNSPL